MALFGCTGRPETSMFHTLSLGKTSQVVPGTGAAAEGGIRTVTAVSSTIALAIIRMLEVSAGPASGLDPSSGVGRRGRLLGSDLPGFGEQRAHELALGNLRDALALDDDEP